MTSNNKYLIFILIVIANIIIKSIYLDATPFWYDEMISVKDTQLDFGHIKHEAEWDNNPPFYYYCLWVWHSVIPVSEFNSRFLNVLFVSISIGLLYLFASKYFDNKTAIASAVLLTVSNFIFFYSQEARAYSLVLLLSIISTIQFFKYIKDPKLFNLIILSLLNFLIIYTHYIAGLIVFVQYLIILFFHKPKYLSFFLIQSLIILGLIFLRFTKKQFLNILNFNKKDDFWLQPAGIKDLLHGLSDLFYNSITAFVFIIIFLVFIYSFFKEKNNDTMHVKLYCLMLGFLSVFFLFLLGTFKPLFLPRYLIFSIPFATVLIVNQLFKFNKAGFVLVLLLIGFETFSINLIKKNPSDYRSIASTISQYKKPEDIVIVNTRDNLGLFLYYINHDYLKVKNVDSLCAANKVYGINDTLSLSQINISKNAAIFLVQSFHNLKNENNTVENYFITKNKKVFSTKFYKGIEFTLLVSYKK